MGLAGLNDGDKCNIEPMVIFLRLTVPSRPCLVKEVSSSLIDREHIRLLSKGCTRADAHRMPRALVLLQNDCRPVISCEWDWPFATRKTFGAVEKTRTSTGVTPQRPQRCASTNSATAALPLLGRCAIDEGAALVKGKRTFQIATSRAAC